MLLRNSSTRRKLKRTAMKVQLLVVDDEQDIRDMLARHFQFLGYEVETAEHGADALEKMRNRKTDVVISDIRMPVMDGPSLCKAIRSDYPMTRIVMITGYVTLENALACLRRGADSLVFKPLEDLTELEDAVNRSVHIIQTWMQTLTQLKGLQSEGGEKKESARE